MIVDDAPSTRRFLTAVIGSVEAFDLVEECASGREAIEAAMTIQPDVVLLDLLLPDMDGSLVLDEILRAMPNTKVVILSNNARRAAPALAASGAAGCLEKGLAPEDLLQRLAGILQVPICLKLGTVEPLRIPDPLPRCAVIFEADALIRREMGRVLRKCGVQVVSEVAQVTGNGQDIHAFVGATRPSIAVLGEGSVGPQMLSEIKRHSPSTLLLAYTTETVPASVVGTDGFRLVVPPDLKGLGESIHSLAAMADLK